MKRRIIYHFFIAILCCLLTYPSLASHIAGGEISYSCVNGSFRIKLDIYQDCLTGDISAIKEDTPAFIGIFNLDNNSGEVLRDVYPVSVIDVPTNFSNECVNNPPSLCLKKLSFVIDKQLLGNAKGYRVAYVRCCRNASTQNITSPSTTGATFFIDIPPANIADCNNSAVFKNFPPQIICVNNPLVYDHGATDVDGDSLSYEFCTAYQGGSLNQPKPDPTAITPVPLSYKPGYSAVKPMTGTPGIQINPKTGIISGTPNLQGRFVVTVCCHEWRNGVRINTIRREFQFVVTNCSKAVVANVPQLSSEFNTYIVECHSRTVKFINQSAGANLNSATPYFWDFGVPGATSTDFEPTYTYPDTGTYIVKLVVNKGSTCPDSISRIVKVYPEHHTFFSDSGLTCPGTPIYFFDQSQTTFGTLNSWEWDFGDGTTSNDPNPVHSYAGGGNYSVKLTSTSVKGCVDTLRKDINIEFFNPYAGEDTIIVKGEHIDFNATGGIEYLWTPADGLDFPNRARPRGSYPDTGLFVYSVHIKSAIGCEGDDSISVLVVPKSSLFVPSAFTPNGDGLNDFLKVLGVGYSDVRFFRIFNRWGEMVFDGKDFKNGWDGTYKGQLCEIGTYFWVAGVTNRFGENEMIKGDVTLIR